ncbi:DHA2 family efflux MFS transporter permease subunit [Actinomadura sp. ATCC 31491]|uniref:DHA2 family efflux MFS transporter permease subunit n=1 Tax=Actinomadura luzonensis TaxID=2805427 RepID=A0ABT0FZW9_9ACTN|nr:DHA2 family efflux MFS transporter permease subunit [Actinomadura luzonensis]MCK2217877.1 DHA2 family efflux MFS transporter permease subunit [Actinomadura luzonensis]
MRYAVRTPLAATGLVVLLGGVMTMLDSTIVNVALTTLAHDFHTTPATVQQAVTGYLLAMSMTVPVTGWAVGRFGARRVWLVSLALFAAGSALCAVAWSAGSLVAFRAAQGLGGGLLMPVGQAMLAQAAGKERMGRAMALISVPAMLVPVLGPPLGGVIVQTLGWRWLFLVNLPLSVVALAAAVLLLPRAAAGGTARQPLDVLGLALLSPGLGALVHGLSAVGDGASPLHPALWIGLALVAAFVVRALRMPGALVDLRLFGDRVFAVSVGAMICYSAAMLGFTVLVPLYSQLARGGSPLDAGLLLAPLGIGAALTLPIAGRLTDSRGARGVAAAGVTGVVAGMAAFAAFPGPLPVLVVGLGHGLVSTSVLAAAYATLERAAIPAATTLSTISLRLGSSFGVAVLAVLLQLVTAAGAARPFTVVFCCAVGLAAVTLVPVALLGSKAWRRSSSAPA